MKGETYMAVIDIAWFSTGIEGIRLMRIQQREAKKNGGHKSRLHLEHVLPSPLISRSCNHSTLCMLLYIASHCVILLLHAALKLLQVYQLCLIKDEKQAKMNMERMVVRSEIDDMP
jgi:hypothetical protein